MSEFGDLLRKHRERCGLSLESFAAFIEKALNTEEQPKKYPEGYPTHATVSNWELGKYAIALKDRPVLVALIQVLHQRGSLSTLAEANRLVEAGGRRALNADEICQIAPAWLAEQITIAPFVPRMAPHLRPQGIVGRDDDLQKIFELLRLGDETADVPPVALVGMGGVGKTTLAIAIGRDDIVTEHFPDGVLWVALGLKPTLRTLLDQWGQALGVNLLAERDEAACQERLRAILFQRRALLIVDDVWDVKHGQAFLLGGPHCRLLLTTREGPIAHELATSARTLHVDILSPEASLDLLRRLASKAVAAEVKAARLLCEKLEFLPLALTLAGQLLANEADVPARLERLMRELIERHDARLKLLQTTERPGWDIKELSLKAILGMSVERLSQTDQDRFAMLSVFGGEPLTWEINATAHVWECSVEEAEATLSHLIQRGLVERRDGRYWMHALLADYAEEMREAKGL